MYIHDNETLWVGLNTGKIQIYSSLTQDIVLKKEFLAYYSSAVVSLYLDVSCFFARQCAGFMESKSINLISISENGQVRHWDANLSRDWIGTFDNYLFFNLFFIDEQIKTREPEYATYTPLSLFIGTWNIDSLKPSHQHNFERQEDNIFSAWIKSFRDDSMRQEVWPDVFIVNFQELVDLENAKTTASKKIYMIF